MGEQVSMCCVTVALRSSSMNGKAQDKMMSRGCHEFSRICTKGKRAYLLKKALCLSYRLLTRADRNVVEDLLILASPSKSDISRYQESFRSRNRTILLVPAIQH